MSKSRFCYSGSVLAISLLLSVSATTALAQESTKPKTTSAAEAEKDTDLEQVVITGSFIRGTPETAAIPVEAINLKEIQDRGSPSNLDLVKSLSEIGAVAGEANRNNAFAIGAQTINLRSLSSSRTVVVFNGRRFPEQYSFSVGRFNNIAVIPNAAIGRVEVLKDGGATTYGADAVGGVVNYITRPAFNGLEANANYRYIDGSKGDYDISVLGGKKYDNFNMMGVLSYTKRSDLPLTDRDFALNPYLYNPAAWNSANNPGSYSFQTSAGQTIGVGANVYTGNRTISATGVLRDPYCNQLGGFSGFSSTPSPVCYTQSGPVQNLVEETSTYQAYLEANYTFSEKLKLHGELLYYGLDIPGVPIDNGGALVSNFPIAIGAGNPTGASQTTTTTATGATVGGTPAYFVPGTNPYVAEFLTAFKNQDGTSAFTPTQVTSLTGPNGRVVLAQGLWRPYGLGGIPGGPIIDEQHNYSKQLRYTLEAKGNLGKFAGIEFDYNTAATYNTLTYNIDSRDILIDRLQDSLNGYGGASCNKSLATPGLGGCSYFNPFSTAISTVRATGQASGIPNVHENSVDLVNWMYVPVTLKRTSEYLILDAVLRGSADYHLWSSQNIDFAVGSQYRRIHEVNDLSDNADRTVSPCATLGVTTCVNRTGPLVFSRGANLFGFTNDSDRSYPVASAFAEVKVPITDNFYVQWATRYEKFFSDIGAKDNDVIVNQGAARWQVTPWLALRGTAGQTFSNVNPPAANTIPGGTSLAAAAYGGNSVTYTTNNFANVAVRPESGLTWNAGAMFNFGQFTGSIDYYHIKIKDIARANTATNFIEAVLLPGQSTALQGARLVDCSSSAFTTSQAALGGRKFFELAGACTQGSTTIAQALQGATVNFFGAQGQQTALYNGSTLETDGIDLGAKYRVGDVWGGDLTIRADSSIVLNWEAGAFVVEGTPVSAAFGGTGSLHVASTKTGGQRVATWRGSIGATYSKGRHTFDWQTNITSAFDDDEVANYTPTAAFNANIGDVNGRIPTGACVAPDYNAAAGAGSGQFGQYNACQNVLITNGMRIGDTFNSDFTYTYRPTPSMTVNLTIQNVFGTDPEFARGILGYDAYSGSALGRTFRIGIRKTL
jgi:iron complex outermembrane receptor protein